MSTNASYRDSGQSVPTLVDQIKIRAGEKLSASEANCGMLQGVHEPVPNDTLSDNALALNEIRLALSKISSNLGKLVPVERQHVVPPAIAASVYLVFLLLIRQPTERVISAAFFTLLLTSFAWPVWTTLKSLRHRLDEIDVKIDVLRHSLTSAELAVSRGPTVDCGPPILTDPIERTLATLKPIVPDEPPSFTDQLDPIPTPVERSGQDELNVDIPTVFVSPAPSEPAVRSEQAIGVSVEQPDRQTESSFGHWSSTLLEIKQRIEPLASGTLWRLPRLNRRGPVELVTLRRITLRLLMYCASLSNADFASPNGFLGPPASVPYYPTGDIEGDRNLAFTTALDCIDELTVLLTGDGKAEIAAALFELAQALSDLGLHEYASTVSGFALENLRDLYNAEPNQFRSHLASIQSLRANIFVDLRQNDDAAGAAEEAVTILEEHGATQLELVYAMLNYAVLLGSIGRGEGALAVAFELVGLIDDSTNSQSDMMLASPLCRLCFSNACIDSEGDYSDLALSEIDKAIEASRASLDANSKVVLAGALLTKSKILSSKGQNDLAYAISAEAITLYRSASVDSRIFSFLLAHTIATHSHQLSEANRKGDSYSTINEAVELWQGLHTSAPVASKRPLAWALFELAKYRLKGADKQTLKNELQIAESAVSTFRDVSPLDYAGLADALYLYADRMLELGNNRDAATFAEESVQYFRGAKDKSPRKHAIDLVFSLSLASSCLACTERSEDALKYAKQAVNVQHERMGEGDAQYSNHLRKLLMDVVFRFTEMGSQQDALPWTQELQQLGEPGDTRNVTGQLARLGGKPQPKSDTEFRKQTNYWMDAYNSSSSAGPGAHTPAPTPALRLDKGKGKEITSSTEPDRSSPRVLDGGKAKAGNPFSPGGNARRPSLAEGNSGAAAQRPRDPLAGMSSARGGSLGSGNNNDLLSSLLDMGGMGSRTLGSASGPIRPSNNDPLSGLLGMGGMGGRTLGGGNNDPLSSLFGMDGFGGPTPGTSSFSHPPTGPAGRPLGSPIKQTARAPPASGRTAGGRLSGMGDMASLESLLGGRGGFGPGSGLGGLGGLGGGGFDPGMFGPEFFGPGNDKDKADDGSRTTTGTGDDTPRSGTWSGMGIQSKLCDDGA